MATTKEEVRRKTISLIEEIQPKLIEKLDKILDSGAIDFESTDDNYKLPKHIMQALGDYLIWYYSNHYATRADKKEVKNLIEHIYH
jgi:hypothetical protein